MQPTLLTNTNNGPEQSVQIDDNISRYECIVIFISILVQTALFIIAAWSGSGSHCPPSEDFDSLV